MRCDARVCYDYALVAVMFCDSTTPARYCDLFDLFDLYDLYDLYDLFGQSDALLFG